MLPLKKLCLNLITKKFERFYFASKVSTDWTLNQSFELLQRKHSFELASKLFEDGNLQNKYLDFLLNEYLKEFNGCWFKCNNDLTLPEDIFRRLPNLTQFSFRVKCCDEDLKNIAKFCPKIAVIDVKDSRVTDDGIKYLWTDENGKVPCPELKKLLIENCYFKNECIKCLIQNLPSLESIDCKFVIPELLYSLHKEDYKDVNGYNFTSINFSEVYPLPHFTDILKVCLKLCPKLKSLECCKISDKRQLTLLNNIKLEFMDLLFSETVPRINLNSFLKNNGYNLTVLGIQNCIISIPDLAVNCPNLHYLRLDDVTFTDNDDAQPIFKYLKKCLFWNMKHDSSRIKAMRSLLSFSPKLESIGIINCTLSADTKTDLVKCCGRKEYPFIKNIVFIWTPINDENFLKNILLNCPSLDILYLKNNGYNDSNTKNLVKLAQTLPNKPCIETNNWPQDILHPD